MFFAVASHSPHLAGQVLQVWDSRRQSDPALRCHALVDCLLEPSFPAFWKQHSRHPPLAVYADQIGFDKARHVSPSLIALPEEPESAARMLSVLLERCRGRPSLGFLVSKHSPEVLQAQLMRLAGVCDGDGQRWLLRFGDTRIWPYMGEWLTPAQHAYAFAGITAWMIVNRYGELEILDGSPDTAPATPDDFVKDFRLTEQQFLQLLDRAEADAHLAELAQTPGHVRLLRSPIEQYDTARQCLATLDRLGIDNDQDRYEYIRFALHFPGDCERQPAVQTALLSASQGEGRLSELLRELAPTVMATPFHK
ncbi:DUF4123 domain-containing protein [Cupriavidus campinensis]